MHEVSRRHGHCWHVLPIAISAGNDIEKERISNLAHLIFRCTLQRALETVLKLIDYYSKYALNDSFKRHVLSIVRSSRAGILEDIVQSLEGNRGGYHKYPQYLLVELCRSVSHSYQYRSGGAVQATEQPSELDKGKGKTYAIRSKYRKKTGSNPEKMAKTSRRNLTFARIATREFSQSLIINLKLKQKIENKVTAL